MRSTPDDSRAALLAKIREGLSKAEQLSARLKKTNNRYIIISLLAGAIGTIISATAAAAGPALGQGPAGWKLTCAAAALCTGIATVFSGLQKQLLVAERLATATGCTARLKSLEFALTVSNRETTDVARDYEGALAGFQDILL